MMNGVDDAYALFRFLRYQPFACWPHFNDHISKPSAKGRRVEGRIGALASLRIALAAVCLRRVKSQQIETDVPGVFEPIVDLPPRTVDIREIDFDEAELDFYQALENKTRTMFDKYVKRGWTANYMHILVLLLKLRQACDHPLLLKETREGEADRDGVRTLSRDELLGALGADRVRALEESIEEEQNCPICMDTVQDDPCATVSLFLIIVSTIRLTSCFIHRRRAATALFAASASSSRFTRTSSATATKARAPSAGTR